MSRVTAVALALAFAALAAAGCGLGPGEDLGNVELTVTRDYGAGEVLGPVAEGVTEADTVMRALERRADISTRYGGGFVQAIEGIEADESLPADWFFYVNGVESTVGGADYALHGGESIWWDYRDWGAAMRVPAVVGSWPQPFTGGYEGKGRPPVSVLCIGDGGTACRTARQRLETAGAAVSSGSPAGALRLLVGPWRAVREDAAAAQIEHGPQASGVFAEPTAGAAGCRIEGLDEGGRPARGFGPDAGLVAATRRYEAPPTWVVTGCDQAGVEAAAGLLDRAGLRDRYAVVAEGGAPIPLPLR
jgi:hypothetical protein